MDTAAIQAERLETAPTPSSKSLGQDLEYLNGVRGFCALTVAILHWHIWAAFDTTLWGTTQVWQVFPIVGLMNGEFAVFMFFILSGRVLSQALYSRCYTDPTRLLPSVVSAIFRRPLRLFLPVLGAAWFICAVGIFFIYIIQRPLNDNNYFPSTDGFPRGELLDWAPNGFFWTFTKVFNNVFGYDKDNLFSVLWTMNIELYGSFAVYIATILSISLVKYHSGAILITIWCILLLINHRWEACFIAGLLCTHILHTGALTFRKMNRSLVLLLRVLIAAPGVLWWQCVMEWPGQAGVEPIQSFMFKYFLPDSIDNMSCSANKVLCALSLLVSIELSARTKSFFSTWPMRYLGQISFGLYLLHPFIMTVLGTQIHRLVVYILGPSHNTISSAIGLTFTLSIVFAIAQAFYHLCDKQAINAARCAWDFASGKSASPKASGPQRPSSQASKAFFAGCERVTQVLRKVTLIVAERFRARSQGSWDIEKSHSILAVQDQERLLAKPLLQASEASERM